MNKVILKDAHPEDLSSIAKCHRSAFPASLSSAMGHNYVVRMLGWYLSSEKTFLFFLKGDNECVGYCGGMLIDGTNPSGSASGMTQFSFSTAVQAILLRPWLFFHPEFISKYNFILKNVRMKMQKLFKKKVTINITPGQPHAGLVVIGVSKKYHGKGFGHQLLKHFENVVASKGYRHLMLTVLSENQQAIKAYERSGWCIKEVNGKSTTMQKFLN